MNMDAPRTGEFAANSMHATRSLQGTSGLRIDAYALPRGILGVLSGGISSGVQRRPRTSDVYI